MTNVQALLADAAYALFALEQPLPLEDVADGAGTGAFPSSATHTPDWFSAAADADDLARMAPELQVLPDDLDAASKVDLSGIDLIRVYAPEMQALEEQDEAEEQAEQPPAPPVEKPRTSTQLGLLKELGGLDD